MNNYINMSICINDLQILSLNQAEAFTFFTFLKKISKFGISYLENDEVLLSISILQGVPHHFKCPTIYLFYLFNIQPTSDVKFLVISDFGIFYYF